jgi:hypothetical protein
MISINKKLGYYTCNNQEFDSKLQALMYSTVAKKDVAWYFNNQTFDNYAWHVEPTLSLDALYDIRARQIRERYDYVIISYSGGADSHNIVESFIRQGLHIDEIVTNWSLDASEKFLVLDPRETSAWNNNAEFKLNTVHKLNYIKNACPRTKITFNDTSRALVDSFLNAKDASWVKKKREVVNANGTNNYNYVYFSELRKQFDKGQRIGLILGIDKPKVKIVDKKFYLFFTDTTANIASVQDHIEEYPNAETVFFYWDSDCVDLLCKQAHIVLSYIRTAPNVKQLWNDSNPPDGKVDSPIRDLRERVLRNVIYTTWDNNSFQVTKATRGMDSELDYWFSRGWQGTNEYQIWQDGINYLCQRLGNYVYYDPSGIPIGTKMFFSKSHYIGDVDA